jgi:hypothetical protein
LHIHIFCRFQQYDWAISLHETFYWRFFDAYLCTTLNIEPIPCILPAECQSGKTILSQLTDKVGHICKVATLDLIYRVNTSSIDFAEKTIRFVTGEKVKYDAVVDDMEGFNVALVRQPNPNGKRGSTASAKASIVNVLREHGRVGALVNDSQAKAAVDAIDAARTP